MNRTIWKWLLLISVSLNIGMFTAVLVNRTQHAPTAHLNLPDHLNLNAEQRQRWSASEQTFLRDLAVNWRAIRTHREALVHQIFSTQPNRAAIDTEQARIAALQDAQQRRVIQQLLAERDLLDERQRAALMTLLLDRYTHESTEEEMLHRD